MEKMEINVGEEEEEAMDLPPGFRFHPTDEELITDYLCRKVLDIGFVARAIGEVDLNKCEPWELPSRAKMGEKEWYFFCVRDRKYPTGLRTNRATESGYWKATGKDKEIFRDKSLVGMKKTLVFYKGRAPKGEKSNWVMHEYRLDGRVSLRNLPSSAKNEWTICRVFEKNEAGKKIPLSDIMIPNAYNNPSENLPPLMESSPYNTTTTINNGVANHTGPYVPCFSNPMTNNNNNTIAHNHQFNYDQMQSIPSRFGDSNHFLQPQMSQFQMNYLMPEQNILRAILENSHGTEVKQSMKTEEVNFSASQDTGGGLSSDMNPEISSSYDVGWRPFYGPSTSGGPVDLGNLWNY